MRFAQSGKSFGDVEMNDRMRRGVAVLMCGGSGLAWGAACTVSPMTMALIRRPSGPPRRGSLSWLARGGSRETVDFPVKDAIFTGTDPHDPHDPHVVAATVIDGGGSGSAVTFATGETRAAVLRGFTITGDVIRLLSFRSSGMPVPSFMARPTRLCLIFHYLFDRLYAARIIPLL